MDWPERAKHGLARESCLFRELFTAVELAVFTVFTVVSQLSVPQGAKHGLARESEAWIEWPKSGLLLHAQSQV